MSDVSVAIMAHPKRRGFVDDYLRPLLPEGTPVVWDRKGDRWDTGRRAMLAHDGSSRHHLVVQDDAILCRGFFEGAQAALEHVPDSSPASFYIGRSRPHGPAVARAVRRAILQGKHWLVTRGPLWGPAVAMPTHRTREVVGACDKISIPNYDTRMMVYLSSTETDCWYSIPSLVDHRVGTENPSLVPGRGASQTRVAHSFIGDGHPSEVNWASGGFRPDGIEDFWYDGPQGKQCSRCGQMSSDLVEAITHAYEHFGGGVDGDRVVVLSSNEQQHAELLQLWETLPERIRGDDPDPVEGERPWLVLVWDEPDLLLAGSLPAMCVREARHWTEFSRTLVGSAIRLQVG